MTEDLETKQTIIGMAKGMFLGGACLMAIGSSVIAFQAAVPYGLLISGVSVAALSITIFVLFCIGGDG